MSTATLDRDDFAAMMQRPKERRGDDDPWFDWKLPPHVPGVTMPRNPQAQFPSGTILRPVFARPRSVDESGVTWWHLDWSEVQNG